MTDQAPKTKSHGRLSIQLSPAGASVTPRDLMADVVVKGAWRAQVITLIPEAFPGVLGQSLTGRALDLGLWRLDTVDLRGFGIGKHRNVDDTPAGGGSGVAGLLPVAARPKVRSGHGAGLGGGAGGDLVVRAV